VHGFRPQHHAVAGGGAVGLSSACSPAS
jgi:hypothetical protein